jgi:hypothetical protein
MVAAKGQKKIQQNARDIETLLRSKDTKKYINSAEPDFLLP